MISTRHLEPFPDISLLVRVSQSLATLDAILQPDPDYRYYSFDRQWSATEMLASMRDGSGDEYHVLVGPCGAIMKGFVHDCTMAGAPGDRHGIWPGVLDEVPQEFRGFLQDPAVAAHRATFCVWRRHDDTQWHRGHIEFPSGPDPDGSQHLMTMFDASPVTYTRWAEQYYETEIPFIHVRRIYQHRPLTEEIVSALNPDLCWENLTVELRKIGYPVMAE